MEPPPRMIVAQMPDGSRRWYLVDQHLNFLPEVKAFLDWKAATRRAPATLAAYCARLSWYYRFLAQRALPVLEVQPADLTEFVLWLCNPYRDAGNLLPIHTPSPKAATSVNLILQAVGSLYHFLVRRGMVNESPVRSIDVPKGKWLTERDLLAHTRQGTGASSAQRMELKLKEPVRRPPTISEDDFQTFLSSIHCGSDPRSDPAGFRDRLLCLLLKEGGFRIGELLGVRLEDLAFGEHGIHIRFRADNANGARAKAGYGRDRLVHVPAALLGLLDIYLTEVWIEAAPSTDHLWIVLKKEAKSCEGRSTYGTALTVAAVEQMFQHYSKQSGVTLHPHLLRHTHATALVRSYVQAGEAVDWKFVQERLGHASVVTTMQTYTHLTNEDRKWAYDRYQEKRRAAHARQRSGTEA